MWQTVVAAMLVASLVSAREASATCGPGNGVTYTIDLKRKTVKLDKPARVLPTTEVQVVVGDRLLTPVIDRKRKKIGVSIANRATGAKLSTVMGPIGHERLFGQAELAVVDATHVQLHVLTEVCIAP